MQDDNQFLLEILPHVNKLEFCPLPFQLDFYLSNVITMQTHFLG